MFSLRILNVDSYQSAPTKGYDICYSEFRGSEVFKVPIIRIFGITPAGQKGCLHVHGVFPYFSVRLKDVFPTAEAKSVRKCLQELALDIDKAINVASRNSNSHRHHVYRIVITEQIPFYGFHEEAEEFLKIYFYNSFDVSRAAELMTNGVILNKFIQPYEAHIPYVLQFFIDYNLFGMNLIKASKFRFRASENDFISCTSPLRNHCQSYSVLDETLQPTYKVWNISTMSSSQVSSLPRQTTCELELDCCSSEILNRLNESFSSGKNPGLLAIWDEERQRRINDLEPSQITPIPSQVRIDYFETESENFYKKKLRKILESFDLYKGDVKPKLAGINDCKSQSLLSNSSDLSSTQDEDMLNMMLSMVNSQLAHLDDDSVLGLNQHNDALGDNIDDETFEMTQLFTAELEEAWSHVKEEEDSKDNISIPTLFEGDGLALKDSFIPQLDGAYDVEPEEKSVKETKSNKSSGSREEKSQVQDEAALIESCKLKNPVVRLSPSVIVKMEEFCPKRESLPNPVTFSAEPSSDSSFTIPSPLCVPVPIKVCPLVKDGNKESNFDSVQPTHNSLNAIGPKYSAEEEDPSNVVFEVITSLIYKVECLTESRRSCYEYLTEEFKGESCSKTSSGILREGNNKEFLDHKLKSSAHHNESSAVRKDSFNDANHCLPLKKRLHNYNWDRKEIDSCNPCSKQLLLDFSKIGREVVVLKKLSKSDLVRNVKLNELKVVLPPLPHNLLKAGKDVNVEKDVISVKNTFVLPHSKIPSKKALDVKVTTQESKKIQPENEPVLKRDILEKTDSLPSSDINNSNAGSKMKDSSSMKPIKDSFSIENKTKGKQKQLSANNCAQSLNNKSSSKSLSKNLSLSKKMDVIISSLPKTKSNSACKKGLSPDISKNAIKLDSAKESVSPFIENLNNNNKICNNELSDAKSDSGDFKIDKANNECKKNSKDKISDDAQTKVKAALGKIGCFKATRESFVIVEKVDVNVNTDPKVEAKAISKIPFKELKHNLSTNPSDLRFFRRKSAANNADASNDSKNGSEASPVSPTTYITKNSLSNHQILEKNKLCDTQTKSSIVGTKQVSSLSTLVPIVKLEPCNELIDKYCKTEADEEDCLIIGEFCNKSKRLPKKRRQLSVEAKPKESPTGIIGSNKRAVKDEAVSEKKVSAKFEDNSYSVNKKKHCEVKVDKTSSSTATTKSNIDKKNKKVKPLTLHKKAKAKCEQDTTLSCVTIQKSESDTLNCDNSTEKSLIINTSCKLSLKFNKKDLNSKKVSKCNWPDFDSSNNASSGFSDCPSASISLNNNAKAENSAQRKSEKKSVSKKEPQGNLDTKSHSSSDRSNSWSIDSSGTSLLQDRQDLKCTISKKSTPDGKSTHAYSVNQKPLPKFKMKRKKMVRPLNIRLKSRVESDPDFKPDIFLIKLKDSEKTKHEDLSLSAEGKCTKRQKIEKFDTAGSSESNPVSKKNTISPSSVSYKKDGPQPRNAYECFPKLKVKSISNETMLKIPNDLSITVVPSLPEDGSIKFKLSKDTSLSKLETSKKKSISQSGMPKVKSKLNLQKTTNANVETGDLEENPEDFKLKKTSNAPQPKIKQFSSNCHKSEKKMPHSSKLEGKNAHKSNKMEGSSGKTDITGTASEGSMEIVCNARKMALAVAPSPEESSNDSTPAKSSSLKLKLKLKRVLTRSNEERIIVVEKELEGVSEENSSTETPSNEQKSGLTPSCKKRVPKKTLRRKMKYQHDNSSLKAKFKNPFIGGNCNVDKSPKRLGNKSLKQAKHCPKITFKPLAAKISKSDSPMFDSTISKNENEMSYLPLVASPKKSEKSQLISPKTKSPIKNVSIKSELAEIQKIMCIKTETDDEQVTSEELALAGNCDKPKNTNAENSKLHLTENISQSTLPIKEELIDSEFSSNLSSKEKKPKICTIEIEKLSQKIYPRHKLGFENSVNIDLDYHPKTNVRALSRRNSLKTSSEYVKGFDHNCSKITKRRHSLKNDKSKCFGEEMFKVSPRKNSKNMNFKKYFDSDDEEKIKLPSRRNSLKSPDFKKFFHSDNDESSVEFLKEEIKNPSWSDLLSTCRPCSVKLHKLSSFEIDCFLAVSRVKPFNPQKLLASETSVLSVPSPVVDIKSVEIDPIKMLDSLFDFPLASNSPFKCSKLESSPFSFENDKSSEPIVLGVNSSQNVARQEEKIKKKALRRPYEVFKSEEREDMGILWDLAYLSPISAHSPMGSPPSCFSPTQAACDDIFSKNKEKALLDELQMFSSESNVGSPKLFQNTQIKPTFSSADHVSYNFMDSDNEWSRSIFNDYDNNSSLDFKNTVLAESKTSFENILKENQQHQSFVSEIKSLESQKTESNQGENDCKKSLESVTTPEVPKEDFDADKEPEFQSSESLPDVRIFDFQECLIESDSDMNPLLSDSEYDNVMSRPDLLSSNTSRDIAFEPYSKVLKVHEDFNLILPNKLDCVPEILKVVPLEDVFMGSTADSSFQKTLDGDLTCNNAIITAADTSSLSLASTFKDNTIPVLAVNTCRENVNGNSMSLGPLNTDASNSFFPVVFDPVATDSLNLMSSNSTVIKENIPNAQVIVNCLEDNELLQSCSVSSTSDIEPKATQAPNVLGIPLNGEEDILSMIVKSCDIGEEFDDNVSVVEENENEGMTSVPETVVIESNPSVPAPDIVVSNKCNNVDSLLSGTSENAVSSSSEKQNSEMLLLKSGEIESSNEQNTSELSDKNNHSTDWISKDDTAFLDTMIHSFYGEDSVYGVPLSDSCENLSVLCPSLNTSSLTQDIEKTPSLRSNLVDKPTVKTDVPSSCPAKNLSGTYPILTQILSKPKHEREPVLKSLSQENKLVLEIPDSPIAVPLSQKMTSYRYCFIPALNNPTKDGIQNSSIKVGASKVIDPSTLCNIYHSPVLSNDSASPQVFNKLYLEKDKLAERQKSMNDDSVTDAKPPVLSPMLPVENISKPSFLGNLISTPCSSKPSKSLSLPEDVSPINKNNLLIGDTKRKRKLVYVEDSTLPSKIIKQESGKMMFHKVKDKNSLEHSVVSVGNYSFSDIEGPTLENSKGFKVASDNFGNARVQHEVQHLTIMSLEIHVNTRKDLRPDPKFDPVTAIFYCIYNDTDLQEEDKTVGMIVVNPSLSSTSHMQFNTFKNMLLMCPGVKNGQLFFVENEILLFDKLIKVVREWDPDILVGYEIQMSSWGYLVERADMLSINFRLLISRLIEKADMKFLQVETDPTITDQTADISRLNITGRIVLCVWRLMRKELTLNIYTFENVYFHVLHKRTPLYSFYDLTRWFLGPQVEKVIRYYATRVQGSIQLLEKLDIVRRTSELARLFGIQFYEVLSRGSQFRVESMMLRSAAPMSYIPVSPSVRQRSHSRAPECVPLILEPESRFYIDPVVVLDFQSLYPSMIIAYNYCFSTCLGRVEHFGKNVPFEFGCTSLSIPVTLLQKLQNDIHVSPTGIAFVKSSVRRGVLPLMLEEILNTRIMVKQSMKKVKNNGPLKKLLDARQMGLKLIANVTYGYTGANFSGRMPCVEVADSIVGKGRETLERAIHMIENTSKWRAKVVYGDTDSLFILLPGRSKKQAFEIGQEIADAVTADNPKPVKLKFEKVYLPCVLQTKKRYVGFMYETFDQEKPVFDAKGIETVRRDSCPATAKILEKSLKILFSSYDVASVKNYVQKQMNKILTGQYNIIDCIFAKEYRGISGYRPGACVPALEIAKKRIAKDPRSEPRVGERVPYVVVYGFPGLPIIQLVREPNEFLKDGTMRINASYYITRVISPPLERVFNLLGADVKSWYTNLARTLKPTLPMIRTANQHKGTLSQYFAPLSCPSCEKPTFSAICDQCREDKQKTTVTLNEKIRVWERNADHLSKICCSCTKSGSSVDHCISQDCPILFKLSSAKKELSQASYLNKLLAHELF